MESHLSRCYLVTGAASGIGHATAVMLARAGAHVVLADIDEAGGNAATDAIAAELAETASEGTSSPPSGSATFVRLDVADEQSWGDAVSAVAASYGRLDGLVNNAGVSSDRGSLEEVDYERYRRVIAVTQDSVFLGCRAFADLLGKSSSPAVVNVSSMWGISGGHGEHPAYHAAKGAVRIMSKNFALAWAKRGIRVNSVHPGWVDTPMVSNAPRNLMIEETPVGRLAQPEEIASVITFLLGPGATFMTGSEVVVDGGLLAR